MLFQSNGNCYSYSVEHLRWAGMLSQASDVYIIFQNWYFHSRNESLSSPTLQNQTKKVAHSLDHFVIHADHH